MDETIDYVVMCKHCYEVQKLRHSIPLYVCNAVTYHRNSEGSWWLPNLYELMYLISNTGLCSDKAVFIEVGMKLYGETHGEEKYYNNFKTGEQILLAFWMEISQNKRWYTEQKQWS
jgi:hypothetical protein